MGPLIWSAWLALLWGAHAKLSSDGDVPESSLPVTIYSKRHRFMGAGDRISCVYVAIKCAYCASSRRVSRDSFFTDDRSLLFCDFIICRCVHLCRYLLYNWAYFAGLIFTVWGSSMENIEIGPLENFPLYNIHNPSDRSLTSIPTFMFSLSELPNLCKNPGRHLLEIFSSKL